MVFCQDSSVVLFQLMDVLGSFCQHSTLFGFGKLLSAFFCL